MKPEKERKKEKEKRTEFLGCLVLFVPFKLSVKLQCVAGDSVVNLVSKRRRMPKREMCCLQNTQLSYILCNCTFEK